MTTEQTGQFRTFHFGNRFFLVPTEELKPAPPEPKTVAELCFTRQDNIYLFVENDQK